MSRLIKNDGTQGWHPQIAYAGELDGEVLEQYHGAGLGYVTVDVRDGLRILSIEYAPDEETFEHFDGSEAWLDEIMAPLLVDGTARIRCRMSATAVAVLHGTIDAAFLNAFA